MALEYFKYITTYGNTIVDRSNSSFAPVPPYGQIYIDFFIPETQPLYLYRNVGGSGGTIVVNTQQNIDDYLNATELPPTSEGNVTYGEYTASTTQTNLNVAAVSATTNNKLNKSTFQTYTGTTAPGQFASKSFLSTYTGTTAPATFASKSFLSTYTGTTAPATFAGKSFLSTYTGTTAPATFASKSFLSTYTGTTVPNTYYNKTQINSYTASTNTTIGNKLNTSIFNTYTGTTAPARYASRSFLSTYTGTTAPATFASKSFLSTYTGTTAPNTYATKANAITGATNLGTATPIYTSVSGNKINLKSLSGGSGISISNTANAITICSTASGLGWTGSTANGVGTYASSGRICSNPNMTFNGTALSVTGNINASTYVCSPIITGSTRVCSPIVCGTSCVQSALLCSTGQVKGTIITGSTCICSPNIYATTSFYEGGTALNAKYASKANAITGATNLGSGNGTIFTTVSGNKINLKSLSGGTNVTITCNGNYIAINASSTSGLGWTGSTANGVATYASASKVCSNPNMTFNGSSLSVTGNILASTYVCSPIITGSTRICSPIVCGTSCITSPVACGTTCAISPIIIGSTCACSPIVLGSTCVCSPVIIGSTCSSSLLHCGACVYATTIVCSPIITGSTCVCSPIICGTSCLQSPITCGTTCAISPITIGSTCVCSPIVLGSTCACSPVIIGSTCSSSPLHCGACMYATSIVCSPIITGSTRVCSPIICGTSCLRSPAICTTAVGACQIVFGNPSTSVLTGNTGFTYNPSTCTLCVPYVRRTGSGSYFYTESTSSVTNATATCNIYLSGTPWNFQAGTYRVDVNANVGNGSSNGCSLAKITCDGNSIHGSNYLLRSQTANFGFSVAVSRDITFTAGCHCLVIYFWAGANTACVTYGSIRAERIC